MKVNIQLVAYSHLCLYKPPHYFTLISYACSKLSYLLLAPSSGHLYLLTPLSLNNHKLFLLDHFVLSKINLPPLICLFLLHTLTPPFADALYYQVLWPPCPPPPSPLKMTLLASLPPRSLPCYDPVVVLTAIYRVERSSQFPGVKSYYCHERLGDTFQQSIEEEILPSLSLHFPIWRILIERVGILFIVFALSICSPTCSFRTGIHFFLHNFFLKENYFIPLFPFLKCLLR